MSRWICVDDVIVEIGGGYIDIDTESFMSAPTIDIVRCGECIHNGSYDSDCPFGWKNGEWNMPKPCDYCSYGEREDK